MALTRLLGEVLSVKLILLLSGRHRDARLETSLLRAAAPARSSPQGGPHGLPERLRSSSMMSLPAPRREAVLPDHGLDVLRGLRLARGAEAEERLHARGRVLGLGGQGQEAARARARARLLLGLAHLPAVPVHVGGEPPEEGGGVLAGRGRRADGLGVRGRVRGRERREPLPRGGEVGLDPAEGVEGGLRVAVGAVAGAEGEGLLLVGGGEAVSVEGVCGWF